MSVMTLTSADGTQFPAYLAKAPQPLAFLVVLHEAFAVTPHIQRVCHDYAQQGFTCIAPDLFARNRTLEKSPNPLWENIGPMPSLPVNKAGLDLARDYIGAVSRQDNLIDIQACVEWLASQNSTLKIGVIGYCFGGSMAYYSAAQNPNWFAAVVAYYGGMMAEAATHAQPVCPTLVHLAAQDRYIPLAETLVALKDYHPSAEILVHQADHGFNRDDGVTYNPAIAHAARQRTLTFLQRHLVNPT